MSHAAIRNRVKEKGLGNNRAAMHKTKSINISIKTFIKKENNPNFS